VQNIHAGLPHFCTGHNTAPCAQQPDIAGQNSRIRRRHTHSRVIIKLSVDIPQRIFRIERDLLRAFGDVLNKADPVDAEAFKIPQLPGYRQLAARRIEKVGNGVHCCPRAKTCQEARPKPGEKL